MNPAEQWNKVKPSGSVYQKYKFLKALSSNKRKIPMEPSNTVMKRKPKLLTFNTNGTVANNEYYIEVDGNIMVGTLKVLISKYYKKDLVFPEVDLAELCCFDNSTWMSNLNIEWMCAILLKNNKRKNTRCLTAHQANVILKCSENSNAITQYLCDRLPIQHTQWLIPLNISNVHWVLVVVDFDLRTFALIDSYGSRFNEIYFTNFKIFLGLSNKQIDHNLSKIGKDSYDVSKWININIPHDLQNDGHNCGIFVLMYIERFLQGGSMLNLALPENYRVKCKQDIVQNVATNICLYCGKNIKIDKIVKCVYCERSICCFKGTDFSTCELCKRYKILYSK